MKHSGPRGAKEDAMTSMHRRTFLAGSAATAAVAVAAPYVHAQKKGGTLKFVPHADLKILDPVWTTAYITRNHGYMIYDMLFAPDANIRMQPQMVDKFTASADKRKWSFTLRDGLKWHDGQPVTAEDCVLSIKRFAARDAVGQLMAKSLGKLAPVDKKTFVLELETPFGLVLESLGKASASPCVMMPARVAATDPNEQIKDFTGSGPFKFIKDEWQPGNKVVYLANKDYVPRKETPSGGAGAKLVYVDRVEWRYIPDQATAAAALEAGEVDFWENPPHRLRAAPREERRPHRVRHRSQGQSRDGQAQLAASALQQQEGPPGPSLHGEPAGLPPGRDRQCEVRQDLPEHLHLWRPVRDGGRRAQAGSGKGQAAPQGERVRRTAHRDSRSHRLSLRARPGPRHRGEPQEDRGQCRHPGHGLVDHGGAPGQERGAGPGWLEHLPHLDHGLRHRQSRGQRLHQQLGGEGVVRLAHQRGDGEAPDGLGARARSGQAEEAGRADPAPRL